MSPTWAYGRMNLVKPLVKVVGRVCMQRGWWLMVVVVDGCGGWRASAVREGEPKGSLLLLGAGLHGLFLSSSVVCIVSSYTFSTSIVP